MVFIDSNLPLPFISNPSPHSPPAPNSVIIIPYPSRRKRQMPPLARDLIINKIERALEAARSQNLLPLDDIPSVEVERPSNPDHGDFATSLPLRLARATRLAPIHIAETLTGLIPTDDLVEKVWAAPPGFLNFSLNTHWLQRQVAEILDAAENFGSIQPADPRKVMVEFVSVNPTGPIHVGHTRGAVLGSVLSAVLQAAGHDVTREYYVNDAGTQMELFYSSVYARYLEILGDDAQLSADGYQGDYVIDLAKEILDDEGERFAGIEQDEAVKEIGNIARDKMVSHIEKDLASLGVTFQVWYREHTLFESGEYQQTLDLLESEGHLATRDGALWFSSEALGDERDNVVVRSSGAPTYFASDMAYHHNKFLQRDFDTVINVWGADHQGHITRLKTAVGAMGVDPDRLQIIITQMVTLKRGNELVKASKRSGDFISLKELVEEVGPDACRYFFLARAPGTQMDFDLELATKESSENPVYYVQYAYARICSILQRAQDQDLAWDDADLSLLEDPHELTLIRKMLLLPEIVEKVSQTLEPHHLPHYTLELATAFHNFYENCRVISNNPSDADLTAARLKLTAAARVALHRCLTLMGMTAPTRM